MGINSPSGWLQIVGICHAVVGFVTHRRALGDVAKDGIFNTIPDFGDRATAFWFFTLAPMTWATGRLLRSAELHGDIVAQRAVGAVVAATGLTGAVLMPRSPFWIVAAIGAASIRTTLARRLAGPHPTAGWRPE